MNFSEVNPQKKPLIVAALLALLLLKWFWPHPRVEHLAPRTGPIVVLGDSLAAGFGAEKSGGYIGVLQKRLHIEIVNKGVSGDTTAMGLARLERDVLALDPALVIVELGGNDFLNKVPLDECFANLDRIIARIQKEERAPVLLLGAQSNLFGNKAAARYRNLARTRHTGFVPNILDGILTRADLKADAIHPNDLGYEAVADLVEPELRWMLKKMKRI